MSEIDKEGLSHEAAAEAENPGLRRKFFLLLLLVALAAMVTVGAVTWAWVESKDDAKGGQTLAEQLQAACEDNQPDDPRIQKLCDNADKVVADAPVKPIEGLTKSEQDDIVERVREAVESDPGLSRDDVVAIVAGQLTKGDQGKPGASGEPGTAGKPPTEAQVRAVVEAVYSANPPADGKDGQPGPQGPSGGPGPQGEAGKDGSDGAPGQSAFPFTFAFTVPASGPLSEDTTYSCTVTGPSEANCAETEQ